MAEKLTGAGRRALLLGWRYLPLWLRKLAVRILFPQFPVGAVAIIRDDAGRVLLVRQTYHRYERWGVPGGWLGPNESPREAAAREALEEVGLQVSVGRLLAVGTGVYGEISLAFECRPVPGQTVRFSDEIDRAGYFSPDRLPPIPLGTRCLLEEAFATQAAWPGVGQPGHWAQGGTGVPPRQIVEGRRIGR
jgi:ADP-ribose pyrophosphatase YjhB (NUDIX family)